MNYCYKCGSKLETRALKNEGNIPYCPTCKDFVFPIFSTACSMIVLNKNKDKILLIQQYGRKDNILVAGYVNKGENIENTVIREIKEETNLNVIDLHFNHSSYFEPSQTLMVNFVAVVDSENYQLNEEVDQATWYDYHDAINQIKSPSLAKDFLQHYLDNIK